MEKTLWLSGSRLSSFMPRTNVGMLFLVGVEMMIFLVPPLRWVAAAMLLVKRSVDSMMMSAPTLFYGMEVGSDSAKILICWFWMVSRSALKVMSLRCLEIESHSSRVVRVWVSVRSLTAIILTLVLLARVARR